MSGTKKKLAIPKANTSGQLTSSVLQAPEVPYNEADYIKDAGGANAGGVDAGLGVELDQSLLGGKLAGNSNYRLYQSVLDRIEALQSVVALNGSAIVRRALAYGLPLVEQEARARGAVIPKKPPKKIEI